MRTATTSATSAGSTSDGRRRRCSTTTRSSCRSGTTSTGRGASGPTSRPPATQGLNLAFFSGNEVFWKTRWERASTAEHGQRTLVCYKETHYDARVDPRIRRPGRARGRTRGSVRRPTAGGPRTPSPASSSWSTPARRTSRSRRSTASCGSGGTPPSPRLRRARRRRSGGHRDTRLRVGRGADNGFRPAGLFDLSSTTSTTAEVFTDYGSTTRSPVRPPTTCRSTGHRVGRWSSARAPCSGLGGSRHPTGPRDRPEHAAGHGQPVRRHGCPAVRPVDRAEGGDRVDRHHRADLDHHRADLRRHHGRRRQGHDHAARRGHRGRRRRRRGLHRRWHDLASGDRDDELELQLGGSWQPEHDHQVTSRRRQREPRDAVRRGRDQCHLHRARSGDHGGSRRSPTPGSASAVEVGVKFTSDVSGTVTGIRFYKASKNTGTHVGNLWTASGRKLASATFTGETASGWQQVTFSSPVSINANTTYVASYFAPRATLLRTTPICTRTPRPSRTAMPQSTALRSMRCGTRTA